MSDATYVYVSQHGAGQISVLRLSTDTGDLTPVQDIAAGPMVMPLAVSPDRRFLYAALRDDPSFAMASFAIDAQSGRLTHLGVTPAFDSPVYLSTDRTGRFLLAANSPRRVHATGSLCLSPIGEQGVIHPSYEVFETPPKLHSVLPDPSNRFVFAASCDGDVIVRYAFDAATGGLSAKGLAPVPVGTGRGPRHLQFHPSGRFLYLVNEYDASVGVFAYDAQSGTLSDIQLANAQPAGYQPAPRKSSRPSAGGADLHLTPDGRWLYVSVRGPRTMAAFAVDTDTGLLTAAGHFPMPAEPRSFSIDPSGRYLFVVGDASKVLVSFRIDAASGALAQLAEYPMGDGPNWVECVGLP